MLYEVITQIMLGSMLNDSKVGVYSVALRFIEIWYFLPVIICSSLFPNIIKAKAVSDTLYAEKMQRLYNILTIIGISISIICYLFADLIINTFFGEQYSESISA